MFDSLQDIQPYCGFWTASHDSVCADIREWINATLNVSEEGEEDEEYRAEVMVALPEAMLHNSLWTAGRKVPDVLLTIRGLGLVQIEVDSGNRDTNSL